MAANKATKIAASIFLAWLLVFSATPVAVFYQQFRFLAEATPVAGRVAEMSYRGGRARDYSAIYSFTDETGRDHSGESGWGYEKDRWKAGDPIPVLYSKSNPAKSQINSFAEIWGASVSGIILVLFLTAFFLFLGWGWPKRWRLKRANASSGPDTHRPAGP